MGRQWGNGELCALPAVSLEWGWRVRGEHHRLGWAATAAGRGQEAPSHGLHRYLQALQCLTERKRQVGEAEVALTHVHVLKLSSVNSLCISYTVPPSQMRVQLGPPPKRQAGFPPLPLLPAVPSAQAGLCTQAQAGCPGLLCTVSCRGRWVPQSRVGCESCGHPLSVDACACLSGMPLQKPDDRAAP